jgi:protein tyrosine/serine phosphatase
MSERDMSEATLSGVYNFRDIGGLPTGDGRETVFGSVFRSDNLEHLSDEDVRILTDRLGVGLVIDLRAKVETEKGRAPWASQTAIEFASLPLLDDWEDYGVLDEEGRRTLLARKYMGYLENASSNLVQALRLLAERAGRNAVIVHCAVGKDRTGVVIALLLSLLGVRRDAIVGDYIATAANMDALIGRLSQEKAYRERMARNPVEVYRAEAHTMELFLESLDQNAGGAAGWAVAHGLDEETIARLHEKLLTQHRGKE